MDLGIAPRQRDSLGWRQHRMNHTARRSHRTADERRAFDRGWAMARRYEAVRETRDVVVALVIIGAGLAWVWWVFR